MRDIIKEMEKVTEAFEEEHWEIAENAEDDDNKKMRRIHRGLVTQNKRLLCLANELRKKKNQVGWLNEVESADKALAVILHRGWIGVLAMIGAYALLVFVSSHRSNTHNLS